MASSSSMPSSESYDIRNVWIDNFETEFNTIKELISDYPYVAIDTEFSGVEAADGRNFRNTSDPDYEFFRYKVNSSKLIQLGLTLFDENGKVATIKTGEQRVWQFNFREFNIGKDIHNRASIELLTKSGIDFKKNIEKGIGYNEFAEVLMSSQIVLCDDVDIVTFDGASDCGYLLKMLTGRNLLPNSQEEFLKLFKVFFPRLYDIRHLARFCPGLYGGLEFMAKALNVNRIGVAHQAGSDSLLTALTFVKVKQVFFTDRSPETYAGVLYGFGEQYRRRKH